jgi:hypothetical protein
MIHQEVPPPLVATYQPHSRRCHGCLTGSASWWDRRCCCGRREDVDDPHRRRRAVTNLTPIASILFLSGTSLALGSPPPQIGRKLPAPFKGFVERDRLGLRLARLVDQYVNVPDHHERPCRFQESSNLSDEIPPRFRPTTDARTTAA